MGCSTSSLDHPQSASTMSSDATTTATHVHHPNADHAVTFEGLAAYEKGGSLKPLQYNPPKLGDEWVEIAISHCGICGSDVGGIDSELMPTPYPCIMGHEVIGTIAAAGRAVTKLAVGDRVGLGAQCHACLNKKGDCPECESGWVQYCRNELTFSIHSTYADGQVTQGGWANRVRTRAHFVFKIPSAIPSAEAAPLMCGGITVFAPLQRHVTRPGLRIGVIGIGGLGHMALMFASKLHGGDVQVTAISHNACKKDDALRMGASRFIDTSDAAQLKAAFRSLDFILCTANGSDMDFGSWLSMVSFGGTFCTVGLTKAPMAIHVFAIGSQLKVMTSSIGTIAEMEAMLEFVAKHGIHPIIEVMPMEKAQEGVQKVRNATVRYRVVLENKQ